MKKSIICTTIMFVLLFGACDNVPTKPLETISAPGADMPPVMSAAETDRSSTADSLPVLDFNGETITILYRNVSNLPDYEMTAEQTGDVIDDAVYNRNLKVAERLNIVFNFMGAGNAAADAFPSSALSSVLAGEDTYDFWAWGQTQSLLNSVKGILFDMNDVQYLDFDKPWWNTSYMNELKIGNDRLYFLINDTLITNISRMSTLFINKAMFEDLYGDIETLYNTVFNGGFTYDIFKEYVTGAYNDLNGDGNNDIDDRYGVMATTASNTDHFAYTAGLNLSKRDAAGLPTLDIINDKNAKIFDKVKELYYNNIGFFIIPSQEIIDGSAERRFASGQTLFHPLWFASVELLRDMEADYGILPYPKLDESFDNYRALVQNTSSVISIPMTIVNPDMTAAVIEALAAESYRTVVPAYYETGLKTKYSRDDISSRMIDLIYGVASTDFVYAYSSLLSGAGTISRSVIGQNKDFVSVYASLESAANTGLNELISLYQK